MKFFSLELSKEMQAAGCVSSSGFGWSVYKEPICLGDATFTVCISSHTPAFTLLDFLSPDSVARENCKLWWETEMVWGRRVDGYRVDNGKRRGQGELVTIDECLPSWEFHRRELLDLPEGEDVEVFMRRTRGK